MTNYISQIALLFSVLFSTLLFSGSANAIGKIHFDRAGIDAKEVIVKLNMFRTGGAITLKGCAEFCPTGLTANKKTEFTVKGKKIKRKDLKKYSGRRGTVRYKTATKSAILINWK